MQGNNEDTQPSVEAKIKSIVSKPLSDFDLGLIADVCKNINDQDIAMTSHAMFLVEEEVKTYGMAPEFSQDYDWVRDGKDIADAEKAEELEKLYEDDEMSLDGWARCYYLSNWTFVSAFFTDVNAKLFIERQKHNYGKMRVYVESGFKNPEWQAMRALLMSLTKPKNAKGADVCIN